MFNLPRWLLAIAALIAVGVILAMVMVARIPFSSDTLRGRIISTLADRLEAVVELDSLTLHLSPKLRATGTGLTIRHHGRQDVPPLIAVRTFAVEASIASLWRQRVDYVKLDGLSIHVPPGDDDETDNAGADKPRASGSTVEASKPDRTAPTWGESRVEGYAKQVVISEVEAPNAQLVILRRDPAKPRRTWSMHTLRLRTVGLNLPMPFESLLTNAVPPGEINVAGTFGPWQRKAPGRTPLRGRFEFDNADLGVFEGISGTLSARGTFDGTLDRIAVDGRTETPNFMVEVGGQTVPLTTTYHAVVDATNGNTTLDPVNAAFLDTSIEARGGVYDVDGARGRIVKLDLAMKSGRLQDIMKLAVKAPVSPMTGQLTLLTAFAIPPGQGDVVDRLQLDGRFEIQQGKFTNREVQTKVNELSRRASGKLSSSPSTPTNVTSDFNGRFKLGSGRLSLPVVVFDIPGAVVELAGEYGLRHETIAFSGNLFMDAKVSQTVTGFKSLLLKVADPLFRRNGRTVVPLKIQGTRRDPRFGLDVKRVFQRDETPSTAGQSRRASTTRRSPGEKSGSPW